MTQLLMNATGPLHHTNTISKQNTHFSTSNQLSMDKAESCPVFTSVTLRNASHYGSENM